MRKISILSVLLVSLSALTACARGTSGSVESHLKRGDDYLAEKKVAEAIVAYRAAVQADDRSGIAHQKLGEAYLQTSDPGRAGAEFVKAADLMPEDVTAQMRAGQVLLLAGVFEDARGRADKVLAKEPKHTEALILKGNALAGLKDLKGALEQVQEAIKTDPASSVGYANLGALQFARGDLAQAEVAFKRAIAIDPKSARARLAYANLLWSSGRRDEAEAPIKEAVKLEPTNILPNQALALLYLGTNRIAEAEAPLKSIAEHSGTIEGQLALADYYVQVQRIPDAKAVYEKVAATREGYATASLRLAALGLIEGDRAGAYRIIDSVLSKEKRNVEALLARAQLQWRDGKIDEALATARSAVAAGPGVSLAHHVLGLILKSQNQIEDAEAAFKDALRASAGFAPANVELSRLALTAGRYADAVGYAQAAIERAPGFGEAHLLLARAQIAAGNTAAAAQPLKIMTTNFPDSPVIQAELGRLLLARGDITGASEAFTRALAKEPLQLVALEGMTVLETRAKRAASARARLDAAVAAAPKNGELQLVAAHLYMTSFADASAAEKAVRRAIDVNPNNLPAFDFLARLHVQNSNLPAATSEFEKLAQRQPKSVAHHTAVGVLYQMQNKPEQARAGYERALSIDPRAAIAANNLAQLYSDRNENLEVALQLAQTAKAGLPNAHEVDDTLGWIYYKKGNALMAVSTLKRAVAANPNDAVYLYHLGAAYALNKDKANARLALEKALKIQAGFAGADDARRILTTLAD